MTTDFEAARDALRDKELFVFDMDGTIYLGERVFDEARRFIKSLRDAGRKVLFFTNNASRSVGVYYERLQKMGFEPRDGEVMTSGDVTARYLLAEYPDASVYAVGTPDLLRSLREYGVRLISGDDGTPDGDVKPDGEPSNFDTTPTYANHRVPDIVLTSFDTTLTYDKLRLACNFIARGARFFSTHPDFNCPAEDGFLPDSGAICALITASTGVEPTYFGKPTALCAETIARSCGTAKEKTVMFGDRLYTDVATARRAGMTSVLMMTGETTEDMLRADLPDDQRADVIAPDMAWVELAWTQASGQAR